MRVTLTLAVVLSILTSVIRADDEPTKDEVRRGEQKIKEGVVRINRDDDALFPKDAVRIAFEKDPAGGVLVRGMDISETFVTVGCTFETSKPGSFISIEPYNVGGRSGRQCAANSKPLYQGIMTIRFCKPGDRKTAATVTTVGFWASHIAVDGTIVIAYDVKGKEIVTLKSTRGQRQFLALRSKTPIAYIKIVPDEQIDPDFAIDDLVFDKPKPDPLMGMKK